VTVQLPWPSAAAEPREAFSLVWTTLISLRTAFRRWVSLFHLRLEPVVRVSLHFPCALALRPIYSRQESSHDRISRDCLDCLDAFVSVLGSPDLFRPLIIRDLGGEKRLTSRSDRAGICFEVVCVYCIDAVDTAGHTAV